MENDPVALAQSSCRDSAGPGAFCALTLEAPRLVMGSDRPGLAVQSRHRLRQRNQRRGHDLLHPLVRVRSAAREPRPRFGRGFVTRLVDQLTSSYSIDLKCDLGLVLDHVGFSHIFGIVPPPLGRIPDAASLT